MWIRKKKLKEQIDTLYKTVFIKESLNLVKNYGYYSNALSLEQSLLDGDKRSHENLIEAIRLLNIDIKKIKPLEEKLQRLYDYLELTEEVVEATEKKIIIRKMEPVVVEKYPESNNENVTIVGD